MDLHASDLPPPRQRRFAVHRHVQCGSGNARSGWLLGLAKFQVPEYGTHVEYPARLFAPVGEPEKGIGQRFEKEDGRAVLSIYVRENPEDDTPASYLRKNLR